MKNVLLLHGALGSKDQLKPLQLLIEQAGFTTHSLNFVGHAREPFVNAFGIETFADQLIQFIEEKRLESVNVFGYSMGGYVALFAASKRPDLFKSIVTLGSKFDWSPESAIKETRKLDPEKILEKVPAFARILEQRHGQDEWKRLLHETAEMMKALGESPLLHLENLQGITVPTLVLLGDQDDMADLQFSKTVASSLGNGRFELLANTPHPIEKVNIGMLIQKLVQHFNA